MNENKRDYRSHRLSKAVINRLVKYLVERKRWSDKEILDLVVYLTTDVTSSNYTRGKESQKSPLPPPFSFSTPKNI